MSLKNLLKIGQLVDHETDAAQVRRMLEAIRQNIEDARSGSESTARQRSCCYVGRQAQSGDIERAHECWKDYKARTTSRPPVLALFALSKRVLKRIFYRQSFNPLAVLQVLAVEPGATGRERGGDNQGIVKPELIPRLESEAGSK